MINLVIDKEQKYMDDILKHLRAYNQSQTGDRKNENRGFYAVRDGRLIGGIKTNLSWDWVGISDVKYDSVDVLKHLLMHVCTMYSEDAVGIKYVSSVDEIIEDFISIGFTKVSSIKYSPIMKEVDSLEYKDFEIQSSLNQDVMIKEEPIEEYDKILKDYTKALEKKHNVDYTSDDLVIVALDGDDFAGGVHGEVYEDHMYINLLVVCDKYRGRGLGFDLMKKIENEIADTNVVTISLGTTEFQAKGFYEKLGYKTIMTKYDLPKGFECYTLLKDVSERQKKY